MTRSGHGVSFRWQYTGGTVIPTERTTMNDHEYQIRKQNEPIFQAIRDGETLYVFTTDELRTARLYTGGYSEAKRAINAELNNRQGIIQITEITRGYDNYYDREADILRLRAQGYDHFTRYADTQAAHALCYMRTPAAEIRHHWSGRHNPATRERIRYCLRVLINQRDLRAFHAK